MSAPWPKDQTVGVVEFYFTKRHESSDGGLEDLRRECCVPRQMSVHQRIQTPLGCHVVCHGQCRREPLLDEEVEDLVRVRSPSAEDALSKRLGRPESLKGLWVRVADDLEDLRSDSRHLVLPRDAEEGRKCSEIWYRVPFGESANGQTVS